MRALAIAIGILCFARSAHAGAPPLIPERGDTLRYVVSNGDSAIARVISVKEAKGQHIALVDQVIRHANGTEDRTRFQIVRTNDGLAYRLRQGAGVQLSPMVCYLSKASVKDRWVAQKGTYKDADGNDQNYELMAEVIALETVQVQAGTFADCLRIELRSTDEPRQAAVQVWLKPELGIVKTRSIIDGRVTETELVAFSKENYASER